MNKPHLAQALTVATLFLFVPMAVGQEVLYTFSGHRESPTFGWFANGAGDVNNDGYDDLIVGDPDEGPFGKSYGSATVLSGKDGAVLHKFMGTIDDGEFGHTVDGVGDINLDGYDDVITGSLGQRVNDQFESKVMCTQARMEQSFSHWTPCIGFTLPELVTSMGTTTQTYF